MKTSKLKYIFKSTIYVGIAVGFCLTSLLGQDLSSRFEAEIDSMIVAAYQTASEEFPCKPGTDGKPRMIKWQDLDKCLNDANERVDWESLAGQIETLRTEERVLRQDVSPVVEKALSAHLIPYSRVLSVNRKDVLLPLTNTVLKFFPSNTLEGLPVFDRKLKKQIGKFFSTFTYEKTGGLSAATTYRLYMFQYTDLTGDLEAPIISGGLLLDSYGVPWEDISTLSGFRLSSDSLGFKY
ncbi:MAG: hypothetical protein P8Z37_02345 [Acidobacteriota bacterium]